MSKISGIFTSVAAAALSIALMGAPAHADGPIVGLITKTNTNPFFVTMKKGFEAKAKELGFTPQALAGKFDQAFRSLKEALMNGYSVREARTDPELASLRARPEFAALLREIRAKPAK